MISENQSSSTSLLSQFRGFLNTPDIRIENPAEVPVFEFPEIEITKALLQDLEKLAHPRNSVLGKRMETFFEIAINHSVRYELIASNIQIIHHKTTIGELDFLLFDQKRMKPLHVELVYKVYVNDDSVENDRHRWIGPNRKDSFSEKMEKLTEKQLPLLYRPETSKYLQDYELNAKDIEQQLCFKGQLYQRNIEITENPYLNTDAICGNWITYQEFKGDTWENAFYYAPKKNAWSSHPSDNTKWMEYPEILEEIELLFEKAKSPLIWMKQGNAYRRFFIVWW